MSQADGELTARDFMSDRQVRWCPGCGDYAILGRMLMLLPELGIPREKIVFVSGIGCSSRFPYYVNTYGLHSVHGRAPTLATGLKLANPELTVFLVTGDGDGLSIGGNHLLHLCRRNVDVKVLLFNNRIYGLTKGQYSPTSPRGTRNKTAPMGSLDRPVNPLSVALAAEVTFAARTADRLFEHQTEVLRRAVAHRGTAFVEILQNCLVFNDGVWQGVNETRATDEVEARRLFLRHGQPMTFGPGGRLGLRLRGFEPEVVPVEAVGSEDLLVHDERTQDPSLAHLLSRLAPPRFPVPLGVLRETEAPVFEQGVLEQVARAKAGDGPADLEALLRAGETWRVG
jgi:2-oxoglutarate ferredoxin oxidoreductase subunit beta